MSLQSPLPSPGKGLAPSGLGVRVAGIQVWPTAAPTLRAFDAAHAHGPRTVQQMLSWGLSACAATWILRRPSRAARRRRAAIAISAKDGDGTDNATATQREKPLFIGANWKCSQESVGQVDALIQGMNECWDREGSEFSDIELVVFPPYVFLDRVRQQLTDELQVGSQNAWDAREGFASTGVVSAAMLRSVGCRWVLLGHSDRRNTLGETDSLIAAKVERCLESGLNVNLTIGEKLEAREAGDAIKVLLGQLSAATAGVPSDAWGRIVVAYEPVWAIGEGATPCSPEETQRVHAALRDWVRGHAGEAAARACRLVYTGSVNEENAAAYAKLPDVDGFVVGRAGLDMGKLTTICQGLARCKKESSGMLQAS